MSMSKTLSYGTDILFIIFAVYVDCQVKLTHFYV